MPTSRADAQRGFTLLELLVVLTLVGLLATAVVSSGRSSAESARVRAFLLHAETMFRDARTAAIEDQTETEVLIDTEARTLSFPAREQVLDVPPGVVLDARIAKPDGVGSPGVRFFPSGGSSGGVLAFQFRGRSYELRINWLTGRTNAQAL